MWRPTPGELIAGKYRVERTIAEGGMGLVLETTHVALGHPFAVKLLRMPGPDAVDATRALIEEARILAQLPGEHIAHAIDVSQTEQGQPYFVMEFLVGQDLEAELQARGRLPVEESVEYALQACEGIAEAHAVGLVHRDLKPANLFLTRRRDGSPLVKVLDFGISCCVRASDASVPTEEEEEGTICGTPAYMAPEQFLSASQADARCDQYALAVVLYELLTGTPPFNAPSVPELCRLVRESTPPPIRQLAPHVPTGLAQAIERALAKNPEERFTDLARFAHAIARYGGSCGVASARRVALVLGRTAKMGRCSVAPPLSEKLTRLGRRGTTSASAAIAVLLAVGLIGWRLDAGPQTPAARGDVRAIIAHVGRGVVFADDGPSAPSWAKNASAPERARQPRSTSDAEARDAAATPSANRSAAPAPPPARPAPPSALSRASAVDAPKPALVSAALATSKRPRNAREVFGAKR